MNKLGIILIGAFLLTACDATPGGNKSILPVEYDGIAEQVTAPSEEAHDHAAHSQENNTTQDTIQASTQNTTAEVATEETKDSVK